MKITGELIKKIRTEMGLTQKELADKLFVSDKAVSKWERGVGLPDISIINELASVLNISVDLLLNGESDKKKMKRLSFYVCKTCGNVVFSTDSADVVCCGRKVEAEIAKEADADHELMITENDGMHLLRSNHEMKKDHYISFIAIKRGMSVQLIETFPEWDLVFRDYDLKRCRIYYYCTNHGLFYYGKKRGKK